jgi:hypothetical protein
MITTGARSVSGSSTRPQVVQMAYLPPAEYAEAWVRDLLDPTMYREHADYRREVEQELRQIAALRPQPVQVMALDVTGLLAFADRHGHDPAARRTRLAYATWLHESVSTATPWPPQRNDPCWCGSAAKYKKCCGSPGFLSVVPPDPASMIVRIDLDHTDPKVWRRVAIPSNTRLDQVHQIIQHAMGWDDSHLYAIDAGEHTFIDPRSAEEHELRADGERLVAIVHDPGDTVAYTYDFGDNWVHTLTLEEVRPNGLVNTVTVLDGAGACPPEDCGGPFGYQQLLHALTDPTDPAHDDALDLLGPDFDPNHYQPTPAGTGPVTTEGR